MGHSQAITIEGGPMFRQLSLPILIVGFMWLSGYGRGGELATHSNRTTQWMIDQEKAWAEQSCGKPWVLSTLLADDFRGTSPKGTRCGKSTETRLSDVTAIDPFNSSTGVDGFSSLAISLVPGDTSFALRESTQADSSC